MKCATMVLLGFLPLLPAASTQGQTITPTTVQNNVPVGLYSYANGLSADGSIVVGSYFDPSISNLRAYIWTNGVLSDPSCNFVSDFSMIDPSGTRAVGWSGFNVGTMQPSHWQSPNACIAQLPKPPGFVFAGVHGISNDGQVLAGWSDMHAVRWNGTTPTVLSLPTGAGAARGYAVSGDGSTIVGSADFGGTTTLATRWTSAGVHILPSLGPANTRTVAMSASAAGSVIVGSSEIQPNGPRRAFRWTQAEGMVDLGLLPGALPTDISSAHAVSPDGTVIVGLTTLNNNLAEPVAFLWRADIGMVPLHWLLSLIGVDTSAWVGLFDAVRISADMTALCGRGRLFAVGGSFQGFVARGLPKLCGPLIYDWTPSHTVCDGSLALLTVSAFHPPRAQYQWYTRIFVDPHWINVPLVNGGNISGATTPTLVISPATTGDQREYFCRVTGGCASADSPIVTLTVSTGPQISQQPPLSLLPCGQGPATTSVTASSTSGPISYQWQAEVPFMSNTWVNLTNGLFPGIATVSGANGPLLTLTDFHFGGHTAYRCILTDACGTTTSWATLIVPCFADFNCDESVDFFDYLDFIADYSDDDAAADINKDGNVDFFDYLDFVAFYNDGC